MPDPRLIRNTTAATLDQLLQSNKQYCEQYRTHSRLMKLIKSSSMKDKNARAALLDCIQVFSDYFQKTVMLRSVFCANHRYQPVVQEHLQEEFGHNTDLQRDRKFRAPAWDPILEAASAWFAWNMLVMDNDEKVVAMHLVLEASANIFFTTADQVMKAHGETNYFSIHAEVDGDHEQMGINLLHNLTSERYQHLLQVQKQCWDMLNTACDQIAITTEKTAGITAAQV